MKPTLGHLGRFWSSEWSLTAFLVLLVVTVFIVVPIGRLVGVGMLIGSITFSLLLISGVAAVSERRAPTLLVTGLVIVTIALRWMTHVVSGVVIEMADALSGLVCLGLMAGVVGIQVFRKGPITAHRIQGAVAVYLLLGLIWGFAYELMLILVPHSFHPADMGDNPAVLTSHLIYFSFVTLTTVGYGDITPAHPIVRSLAILEALVGQLYPAILIGRLVALELSARQSKPSKP
jgi:hypothetical protein